MSTKPHLAPSCPCILFSMHTRRLLPPDPAPTPQPPPVPQILHASGLTRTQTMGGTRSILWLPQGPGKQKQQGKDRPWPGQDTGASIIKEPYPCLTLLNASLCSKVLPCAPGQRSIAGTWPAERLWLHRGRREHGGYGPLCTPAIAPRTTPLLWLQRSKVLGSPCCVGNGGRAGEGPQGMWMPSCAARGSMVPCRGHSAALPGTPATVVGGGGGPAQPKAAL